MSLETIVQSSSAVTIATIGFVNVGLLTLRQALLDDLRATRRLVDQLLKADRLLRGPKWAAEIEAGVGTAGSG